MNILRKQPRTADEKAERFSMKKLGQTISTVILILCTLLCFLVVVRTAVNQEASLFGCRLFYVATGSMEPTLPVNSLLLVQRQEEYQVGDIITYYVREGQIQGYPNTHRIIVKNRGETGISYTTQGDANSMPDPYPVKAEDVIGRVRLCLGTAALIGSLLSLLTTPGGFFAMVLLPLLSIAVICMSEFKKVLKEEMMRSAREALEAELAGEKEGTEVGAE